MIEALQYEFMRNALIAGADKYEITVDAHFPQHHLEQTGFVLAIPESAVVNLGRLVGLVAVDPKLKPDVAGVADDMAVERVDLLLHGGIWP